MAETSTYSETTASAPVACNHSPCAQGKAHSMQTVFLGLGSSSGDQKEVLTLSAKPIRKGISEFPEDVIAGPNGSHRFDPMSPMTPDPTHVLCQYEDDNNQTLQMEYFAADERIACLSPIVPSRESICSEATNVVPSNELVADTNAFSEEEVPRSPDTPSQESSMRSNKDLMDDQSTTQAAGNAVADTTDLSDGTESSEQVNPIEEIEANMQRQCVIEASAEVCDAFKKYDADKRPSLASVAHAAERDTQVEQADSIGSDKRMANRSSSNEDRHDPSGNVTGEQLWRSIAPASVNETTDVSKTSTAEADSSSPSRLSRPTGTEETNVPDEKREVDPAHEQIQTYRSIASAKKHLDASSTAFIERLRGAAHRRKLQVARSRDLLLVKEKEHLWSLANAKERQLAASKETGQKLDPSLKDSHETVETSTDPYRPFKARPAPSSTGELGSGGHIGIPKVGKKATTMPFSPLLGARRRSTTTTDVSNQVKSNNLQDGAIRQFKARPAPPTTGYFGHGGQAGIPKVPKRPTTVPVSPFVVKRRGSLPIQNRNIGRESTGSNARRLPPKISPTKPKPFSRLLTGSEATMSRNASRRERQQQEANAERKAREFRARPLPTSSRHKTASFSPGLLGLKILNKQSSSVDSIDTENIAPSTPGNQFSGIRPYEPHSTVRAQKRALFDARRASNEIVRQEEQRKARELTITKTKAEMSKLSGDLR